MHTHVKVPVAGGYSQLGDMQHLAGGGELAGGSAGSDDPPSAGGAVSYSTVTPQPQHYEPPDHEYHSLDGGSHHPNPYIDSSPEFYSAPPPTSLLDTKYQPHYVRNCPRSE